MEEDLLGRLDRLERSGGLAGEERRGAAGLGLGFSEI